MVLLIIFYCVWCVVVVGCCLVWVGWGVVCGCVDVVVYYVVCVGWVNLVIVVVVIVLCGLVFVYNWFGCCV